jgi:environmental stress-induced protein Ves
VTALFSAQPLAFACDYPTKAQLPNGATATKEDMLAGQTAVKEYMTAMETYLTCIEQEEKDTVASMTEITEEERASRDATLTKKYNAAVEEMELLAAQFNEEVRAYKAKSE